MNRTDTFELIATAGEPTLEMRRFLKAPPELVFEVWTTPKHLKNWWGPRRLEIASCEIDLRVGGRWQIVERAADGTEFTFFGEYLEIERPLHVVNTWIWAGMPDHPATEDTYFEAVEGGTVLRGIVTHDSVASRDQHLANGMEEGMTETYERLLELLATLQTA